MADGGASTVLAIATDAGVPLAETQKELTPLQRLVISKELERQHEEAQQNQRGAGSPGPVKNSRAAPGGGHKKQGDTIRYVNEGTEDG